MANTSQKELVSSGSKFEALIGYSRAVVSGDWIFVSGCTGHVLSHIEVTFLFNDSNKKTDNADTTMPPAN